MLLGDLTPGDRQKIMTVCTIDVHARDVVANLISQKVRWARVCQTFCMGGSPPGWRDSLCLAGDKQSGLCVAVAVAPSLG